MVAPLLFGLPTLPEKEFNRLANSSAPQEAITWTDDGDGALEPEEVQDQSASYVTVKDGKPTFTPKFETLYRRMAETYRQERVTRELSLTYVESVHTNMDAWLRKVPASVGVTDEEILSYKEGLAALLAAAPFIQEAFNQGVGYTGALLQETLTDNDQELIQRYGHPWCTGDQSAWCVALPSLAARTSGVIISGATCEELGAKSQTLGTPFTAIGRDEKTGQLVPIPYARYYADQQQPAAVALESAAALFAKIPRERALAKYLHAVATAFTNRDAFFPYHEADQAWREHGASDSLLYVRVGPDETGTAGVGDSCGLKARHHMRLGLKNFALANEGDRFKPYVQAWEHRYAELIGDPTRYVAQPVVVKMPEFWDLIFENGDAPGNANGNVIGQTLPNWCGADGTEEPCARRTMIFANKESRAYSTDIMSRYILPLFAPTHHADFQREIGAVGTVLHELTHNLGPQIGKLKPGSDIPFNKPLQKWAGAMEEFKAQNGALDHAGQLYVAAREQSAQGKITPEELTKTADWYRTVIMRSLAWSVRMVVRATRNGKFEGTGYSKLAAVQLGVLTEAGALSWDTQGQYWHVDFSRMPQATTNLTRTVLQLYAEGNFAKVDAFFTKYLSGDGFPLLHADRLQAVAGKMPSAVFDYKITGLQ